MHNIIGRYSRYITSHAKSRMVLHPFAMTYCIASHDRQNASGGGGGGDGCISLLDPFHSFFELRQHNTTQNVARTKAFYEF